MKLCKTKKIGLFLFFISSLSYADILVEVTATMMAPMCTIRTIDGNTSTEVHYDNVNVERLENSEVVSNLSINISDCDFSRQLSILLSPKGGSTIIHDGQGLLSTSTKGLGIAFKDITSGNNHPIDVSKKELINPVLISTNLYRFDLEAKLINIIPASELVLGPFNSSMTILMDYH